MNAHTIDDAWGIDVFLELKQQGFFASRGPQARGAMPLPHEVADAMIAYAATLTGRRSDRTPSERVTGDAEAAELRADAARLKAGADRGRTIFRDALLEIDQVKSGVTTPFAWLAHLPPDVLEPWREASKSTSTGLDPDFIDHQEELAARGR